MAKNRIGIEVQVEFPTVTELQNQLADKWKKVKNGFEGKINIDVDGHSLNRMKSKIQRSLGEQVFDVKLDSSKAIQSIKTIKSELKELDRKIEGVREVKIDFKLADMDKTFKELLEANKKVEKVAEETKQEFKNQGDEIDKNIGKYSKFVRLQRQLKNGSMATTQKMTTNSAGGQSKTVTQHADGRKDVQIVEDREKALKEIEAIMKKIHNIQMDMDNSEGEQHALLRKQGLQYQEQLMILKGMYKEKYKIHHFEEEQIKELKKTQEISRELNRQERAKKEATKAERELAQIISKVAQIEQKKQQLAKQLVTATEAESTALREQYNHHERIQDALKQEHNLAERMTAEQKEELQNIRTIGALERERLRAKKQQQEEEERLTAEQREQAQAEKAALADMKQSLKDVHKIEMQIDAIKERQASSSRHLTQEERNKLQILESELESAKRLSRETELHHTTEGNISDESREQLRLEEQILQRERERVQETARIQGQQDDVTANLRQHEEVTRQIGQLQRDMIFSGMREQSIIENQIESLRDKQKAIRNSLESQNAMTDAMREEIALTERLQREQRRLSQDRQSAREKDRAFNDTGGLVDPFSFASHVEQGAMTIFEPIRKLDEALVGITKVAEGTEAQFEQFADGAYDAGAELGVAADEYMLAVEKWVTAGKSFAESQELANVSLVGSFVGGISPDDMVKYMSVPLSAFKKENLQAQDVINTMNETANNHAIEMNDLGKAYVRSSGTSRDAGVNFDELTGLITAAQEGTRKGGESIGTGIKAMSTNLSNIFAQNTAGEERKFSFFNDELGIDMADEEGKMRSLTDIMRELQGMWDGMAAEDQGTAKFYLAGKLHSETMSGILNEWETVEKTIGESSEQRGLGESGSAYIEHNKQADSVKFKLAELKNAWDELMHTIGGGKDGVGGVMTVLTNGLQTLNSLAQNDKLMETLKYIFAGLAIHAGANLYKRFFDTIITGYSQIMKRGGEVRRLMGDIRRGGGGTNSGGANGGSNIVPVGGAGGTGGTNGSNGTNGTGSRTTVVPSPSSILDANGRPVNQREIDEANRRNAEAEEEANRRGSRTNSRLATTGKLAKGLLGFIPLLGDALLILELTGVPVFDTIGKGFKAMFGSAEEGSDDFQKSVEKFQKSNGILNGEIEANQKALDGIKKGINEKLEIDRNKEMEGKQSYLTADEYDGYSTQFNDLANSLGKTDIQITMNDTEHIKSKIKELQTALNQLSGEQNIELTTNLTETSDKFELAKTKYQDLKARSEGVAEQLKIEKEELKKVTEEYGEGSVQVEGYERSIKSLEKKQKDLDGQMHETKLVMTDARAAIYANADAFLEQGKNVDLANMSADQAKEVIPVLENAYKDLHRQQSENNKLQKVLNGDTEITKEKWNELIKTMPQLGDVSYEQMMTDKDLRKSMLETAEGAVESGKEQIEAAEGAMIAVGERADKEGEVKKAINETKEATKKAGAQVDAYSTDFEKIPSKVNTSVDVNMDGEVSLWERFTNWITGGKKSASVSVNVKENIIPATNSSFIRPNLKSVAVGTGGASSASVSTGGGSAVKPARVKSVSKAESTTEDTSRVDSDVWRYWKTEMKIEDITQSINKLTASINQSAENEDKLIKLYKEQNSVLRTESSWQKKLSGQKQSEMSSVLKSLRKYGFKTSGNDITNLGISKNMKGEKATKVNELLNTWKSLGSEMTSISESIATLNETIKTNNEAIKAAQIQKELERLEKVIQQTNNVMTMVGNSSSLADIRIANVESSDSELGLLENEKAMNVSKANMNHLIYEFNKLSKATINYKENGEVLESQLSAIGTQILAQADAAIAYQQAINDIEIGRITNDLAEFNKVIDDNSAKIDNNIKNLQEGLLSGTDIGDLQSSKVSDLDLDRNNQFEKAAQERIKLEEQVQDVMEAFAKKNVERQKNVANSQLSISNSMYKELLRQKSDYDKGKYSSARKVTDSYNEATGIEKTAIDKSYKFADGIDKIFDKVQDKQEKLTKDFEKNLSKLSDVDARENLTNKYVLDSMKVQEEYFNASIEASKKAISELNKQLKDQTLTDAQEAQIKESIKAYEDGIVASQNSIKESIKSRFEYEFSLLDEAVSEYDKYTSELEYAMGILDSIGGDNNSAYGALLSELLSAEKARNTQITQSLGSLKEQLSMYEEGSYEWEILNLQVENYNSLLKDSNRELLDMNKNIMANSFEGTMNKIEKELFDGETVEQFNKQRELWLEGLEREIALEDTYQRLADLETSIHDEKMLQLAKQEKLSKYEMDYLNKQLDVLELQQKLENLNKERTVQVLKQQTDGTWDWTYEADATQVSETQDELMKKQLELQQAEDEARKSYLSQLEGIIEGVQSGEYDNLGEFQDAIQDLGKAFESIVGDFPEIEGEYLEELIDTYGKYIGDNQDIIDAIANPVEQQATLVKGFGVEVAKAFSDISGNIGEAFASALLAKMPNFGQAVKEKSEDKSVSIVLEKLEFPNIKTADGIKDAIMSLPQIALQQSKSK